MNSKLHALTDALGRPWRMFLTAGQRSDYIGARALLRDLREAKRSRIGDMMRIGIAKPLRAKELRLASLLARGARFRSLTTPTETRNAIKSRTALPVSRTGGASQPDMTGAQRSFYLPAPWLQWSCSGYES